MIFDVNIGYGVWPFRTTVRTAGALVKKLRAAGVTGGYVHSMENVWNFDIDRCNESLLEAWKKYPEFRAVPTLHEDYRQSLELLEAPEIPGGIIYPNYHGFKLSSLDLIPRKLQKLKKTLIIPLRQEDERNQHPLAQVPAAAPAEVLEFCRRFPDLKVIVLNARNGEALELLQSGIKDLYCDTAFIDGGDPFVPFEKAEVAHRLLFGSGAPLLEALAGVMKHQDNCQRI